MDSKTFKWEKREESTSLLFSTRSYASVTLSLSDSVMCLLTHASSCRRATLAPCNWIFAGLVGVYVSLCTFSFCQLTSYLIFQHRFAYMWRICVYNMDIFLPKTSLDGLNYPVILDNNGTREHCVSFIKATIVQCAHVIISQDQIIFVTSLVIHCLDHCVFLSSIGSSR